MKFISQTKDLKGKRVLLRADLDAPHENGKILDDYRIRMAVPTIKYLLDSGAKLVIVSKNGKPKGVDPHESLDIVHTRLQQLLGSNISFYTKDFTLPENQEEIKKLSEQQPVLLENVRFYPDEQKPDMAFAKTLSQLGELYVNDAFAMMHRNEASVSLIPTFLPAYAGLNVEKELNGLNTVLKMRAHPFIVIIGGAKISDKVGVIKNLGREADKILVGGGPSVLFLAAKGYEIGKSISEQDQLKLAEDLLRNYKSKIALPIDVVVADPENLETVRVCAVDKVKPNEAIYDIGPKTILEFSKYIKGAQKMIWNGPMGWFEKKQFSHGTISLALIYASRCKGQAFGMIGGGDTVDAVDKAKVREQIDFVSTAGGATLDYLAGDKLPGLIALEANG